MALETKHLEAMVLTMPPPRIAKVLKEHSLIGTECGDAVIAHLHNHPAILAEVRQEMGPEDWGSAA